MFKTLEEALAAYKKLEVERDALTGEVEALKTKSNELLAEKKAEKAKRDAAESKLSGIESELDEMREKAARGSGDLDAYKKSVEEKHKRDLADRDAKIADRDARIHRLVITDGLKAALTEAGVAPHFLKAAEAMLSSGAKVEADGDTFKAMIGDKPLAEAVKAWAASPEGKHFVVLKNNGGGATGGGKVEGFTGKNPYAKDTLNRTEQGRLERDDPELAKQLKEAARAA